MNGELLKACLQKIKSKQNSTMFFLEIKGENSAINNFVPICMKPPVCTFTSKFSYNLESTCKILMLNTISTEKIIDRKEDLKAILLGRIFHVDPLEESYLYLLEITEGFNK